MVLFDAYGDGDDDVGAQLPRATLSGGSTRKHREVQGDFMEASTSIPSSVAMDSGASGKKLVVDFPGYGLWTYAGGAGQPVQRLDVTSMMRRIWTATAATTWW